MIHKVVSIVLLLAPAVAAPDGAWTLVTSTLSQAEGVSHAAQGTGTCQAGQCSFRFSVALKSFESGDTQHDLQMVQMARGALFPLMQVRIAAPEAGIIATSFRGDVEIQWAGQTVRCRDVAFQVSRASMGTRVTGMIPARMSDFRIDHPAGSQMPIRVDMTWRPGL